jgi:hypothetical protein
MNEKNEAQPNFKVTDRRLFNADGTARDLPPEEKVEVPLINEAVQDNPLSNLASAAPPVADSTQQAEPDDEEMTEEEMAAAQDPASFLNFLMSIASNAASSLGMMEHPVTHQREVDLELGKHWIDVLGMLEAKTRGNLTPQEKKMLEGLLADLRMQYVSLSNAPQKAKSYSSRDITGGR